MFTVCLKYAQMIMSKIREWANIVKAMGVKIARKVIKAWNFAQVFTRTYRYLTISGVEPLWFQCCLATVTRRSIFLSNQHQRCSFWGILISVSWLLVLNDCTNASGGYILAIYVILTPWCHGWPALLLWISEKCDQQSSFYFFLKTSSLMWS